MGYKEVRNMLEKGINPNTIDEYGNTDHQNYRGDTAAHYAFAYGYKLLAEYILSKGADDRLKNELGLRCYQGISTCKTGVKKGSGNEKKSPPTLQSISKKHHHKAD